MGGEKRSNMMNVVFLTVNALGTKGQLKLGFRSLLGVLVSGSREDSIDKNILKLIASWTALAVNRPLTSDVRV